MNDEVTYVEEIIDERILSQRGNFRPQPSHDFSVRLHRHLNELRHFFNCSKERIQMESEGLGPMVGCFHCVEEEVSLIESVLCGIS